MIYLLAYEPFVRESSTTCGMSRINHGTQKLLPATSRKSLREALGATGGGTCSQLCFPELDDE